MTIISTTVGKNPLERMEQLSVNKRVQNAVPGCNLKKKKKNTHTHTQKKKTNEMISVRFQGKLFNITVIQVYAPTTKAEEVEVKQFYEDLPDLLELTPKKDVLFIIGSEVTETRSVVSDSAIPWTAACQAPLSMEFSRQEY